MRNTANDERTLIAASVLSGDKHLTLSIRPSDFADGFHGLLWSAIQEMKEVDVSELESRFIERRADIEDIISGAVTFVNMQKVACRIMEAAHRRRVMDACRHAYSMVEGGGSISDATGMIERAADGVTTGDGWRNVLDGVSLALDSIEKAMKGGENMNFIPSGISAFDACFGGLQKNGLIIISGRPGSGKSSLAAGMARWSSKSGPCLITSFEMGIEQISMRYLGMEARVDMSKAADGVLSHAELSRLGGTVTPLGEAEIYINDTPYRTPTDIVAEARRFKRKHGKIGMLIVDHLGLLDSEGRNNLDFIEDTTRKMKQLAKELECPVLLLVQMNRNVESRATARPQMSDLRGCGTIEADSDQIIFPVIDVDEKSKPRFKGLDDDIPDGKAEGNATLYVEKNRNGTTGSVRVEWVGAHTTYRDIGGSHDRSSNF